MRAGDTIAACATPPGRSLRAMVRLSGSHTIEALKALGLSGWHDPSSGRASMGGANGTVRGRAVTPGVLQAGALKVPVLVAVFPGPHSYTGEDSAEIQFPGNPALVQRVLEHLTTFENVRLAQPGEFTARAYLSGRLSLAQAEGVAATIAANTNEQLDAARELLEGSAGERYAAWSEELATLLALVEAGIDFTDQEDVVAIEPSALSSRLRGLHEAIGTDLGGAAGAEAGASFARVVLVGEPNAGKSTLFNALLSRKRAVTSPVAGTTRDVLSEELDLSREVAGAGVVVLQDVPGLERNWHSTDEDAERGRAPKARPCVDVDSLAQDVAREALEKADLLIWCDPRGRFEAGPLRLPSKPTIRLRTFGDQPHPHATGEDLSVCALDGWNLSVLRRAIADAATTARAGGIASLLPRHRRAMSQAYARLSEALAITHGVKRLNQPEVVALTLRHALDELGELVGQISPDEVLGRVFSTFCVGK